MWTLLISHIVVDWEVPQNAINRKLMHFLKRTVGYSAVWDRAPCHTGDDSDFGISESLFPLSFTLAYSQEEEDTRGYVITVASVAFC
jgi:hypothetical protein